jgi:hypothetical protein
MNPLKPATRPRWQSSGANVDEELWHRELLAHEERIQALSQENQDLRDSMSELFRELQAALGATLAAPSSSDDVAVVPPPDSLNVERRALVSPGMRTKLETALQDADFTDAQLALPFHMVRPAAEHNFRTRLAVLQDQRIRLQAARARDAAAEVAVTQAAASAHDEQQRGLLKQLLERFAEYRGIIEEQESLLQTVALERQTGTAPKWLAQTQQEEQWIAESRRLSLDADRAEAGGWQQEQRLQALRAEVDQDQQNLLQARLVLERRERDLDDQRAAMDAERLSWQQQRLVSQVLTVPPSPFPTPQSQGRAPFASHSPLFTHTPNRTRSTFALQSLRRSTSAAPSQPPLTPSFLHDVKGAKSILTSGVLTPGFFGSAPLHESATPLQPESPLVH